MEDLYRRLDVASSQYEQWTPGQKVLGAACTQTTVRPGKYAPPETVCVSRVNHRIGAPATYIPNPPPETSDYIEKSIPDDDADGCPGCSSHPGGLRRLTGTSSTTTTAAAGASVPDFLGPPINTRMNVGVQQQQRDTLGASMAPSERQAVGTLGLMSDEAAEEAIASMAVRKATKYTAPPTIGATSADMSAGVSVFDTAMDIPIRRHVAMFDSRYRNLSTYPMASFVRYKLTQPIYAVSRIVVDSIQIPIWTSDLLPVSGPYAAPQYYPQISAYDYVMMSIGIDLPDVVPVVNDFQGSGVLGAVANPSPTFGRTLAYVWLIPYDLSSSTVKLARYDRLVAPGKWYVDFPAPLRSVESLEISFWVYRRNLGTAIAPAPTSDSAIQYVIPGVLGGYGDMTNNTQVVLEFFGKDKRTE